MFKSATLRLTGWYLLIIALISITFSVVIFQVANNEVQNRLERFQSNLQTSRQITTIDDGNQTQSTLEPNHIGASIIRNNEEKAASNNLAWELFYINLVVLVSGGLISYWLAKRSLMPIEKAHAAQSRFTSDASHELRTPLAVMKTEIEVALMDNKATTKSLRETLTSNLEEVNKLSHLSEMLLNLSRLENTKLKMSSINLNKVVRGTVKMFCVSPERIHIKSSLTQHVFGNEMALTDLVKVLADNAVQYSTKGSKIYINISKQDNCAKFEIINSGPGIQPDKMDHLFERFYRADASRTDGEHKSYGLGLALAKSIVDLHNGRLFVTSTPNESTIFTFLLPLNHFTQAKTKN